MFSSSPNLLSAVPLAWAGSGQQQAGTGSPGIPLLQHVITQFLPPPPPSTCTLPWKRILQPVPAQPQGSVLEREGKGGKASSLLYVAFLSWLGCRITKTPFL